MNTSKFLLSAVVALAFISCADNTDGGILEEIYPEKKEQPEDKPPFYSVDARENSKTTTWKTYTAKTVDRLTGYTLTNEPERDEYGGWKIAGFDNTGKFHTQKMNDRWWLVDPSGNPFIHTGVAVFSPGNSERSKNALIAKYGSQSNWATQDMEMLKGYGFNGTGAWTSVNIVSNVRQPLIFCVFIEPMAKFKAYLKDIGDFEGNAGWQGYPNDVVRVFDPRFDQFVESEAKKLEVYAANSYMLGYFTDNELPWVNNALDRFLKNYKSPDPGYLAAKKWLDERKGHSSSISEVTDADRAAFTGFYFETYMKKVTEATRKYAPDKLYLGCRFNQHNEELANAEIFRVAGQYMDVVSLNHYRKWEPESDQIKNWVSWSDTPFIVTEFYVKGEDSGLPNTTGAGWNVKTQEERGYFYQNFTLELIRSKACVGWHWFSYHDNDPEDVNADDSNKDSNKGIVTWDYKPYYSVLDNMKALNSQIFQLTKYYDQK